MRPNMVYFALGICPRDTCPMEAIHAHGRVPRMCAGGSRGRGAGTGQVGCAIRDRVNFAKPRQRPLSDAVAVHAGFGGAACGSVGRGKEFKAATEWPIGRWRLAEVVLAGDRLVK